MMFSHDKFWTRPEGRTAVLVLLPLTCLALSSASLSATYPRLGPQSTQTAKARDSFRALDRILEKAVEQGDVPGAVLIVGHQGKIVYRKAFGSRSLEPLREPMTIDTVFDLASMTKCVATATAVMQLVEQGRVRLNDPVKNYIPEFAKNGKADVTVRELLTHFSGLAPDLDLENPWHGKEAAFGLVMDAEPAIPPGSRFVYSDINFEALGFLVENITGQSLSEYTSDHIFQPLGMKDTRFLPPQDWIARIAPTEYDEHGRMLRGVVHDPTARRMGGVAGHAGLFSTADDLARYAEDVLRNHRILSAVAMDKMSTPQQPATAATLRGLGWDIDSPFSTNRGELLPVGSFGHTGFTGTSIWLDPITVTYVILLTNAVHPHVGKSVISLRTRIATAVAASLNLRIAKADQERLSRITGYNESMMAARRLTARNGEIKTGIDVLEEHGFRELHPDSSRPVRVGLVANQTAMDAHGQRTADVIAAAPGVKLAAIFSPEHGVGGDLDTSQIGDTHDKATGAPIYSVYGDSDAKRRPRQSQVAEVDVLVFDIQDVGVRFYTYESTLGYFLEAAAKAGKPIVVLDRPNPINGSYVQGPVADSGADSFVSYWRTPIRHGMTIGELASMFNAERKILANLTVVCMMGWQRGDWFDSTSRLWINPSPNMRSVTEAELYPGIGMIEATNITVGRGTDTPFEVVGAPWIDPILFASYLNKRDIGGIRFVPIRFTPAASNYTAESCGGVYLIVTDRDALDGPELGLEIAAALVKLYPDRWKPGGLDTLMKSQSSLSAIERGEDPRRVADDWRDELADFMSIRAKYILY